MEDKTQYEALVEELQKTAENFRVDVVKIGESLAKVLADIQTSKKEEDTWEMKCPYEKGDELWCLYSYGGVYSSFWADKWEDKDRFNTGNVFPTEKAAELEVKRRNLLTRFRAFRDECNDGWKADWKNHRDRKYFISFAEGVKLVIFNTGTVNQFCLFGYFKDDKDTQRAIELFGDEIKELFVDLEED